jgi:hypothetical protein
MKGTTMAEPLLSAAYDDLRTARVGDWLLEIRADDDAPVLRVAADDPRLTVTDNPETATTAFVLALTGADDEVTLPITVDRSVLYTPENVQVTAVQQWPPFTLGADADQVTITHTVELPASEG